MQKITPHLWFDKEAEEAAKFYTSIFRDSKILNTSRYGDTGKEIHGQEAGTVLTVDFELNGQRFVALNGGPIFKFNESVSFLIDCEDQDEIDYYWEKLSAVPEAEQCGWLKDKFGLSWQVVPGILSKLLSDKDAAKAQRVMGAMMKMKKIIIADLQKAADQK